jgi:hypothetical protein
MKLLSALQRSQTPGQCARVALFRKAMSPLREADNSPLPSAKHNNVWHSTSSPPFAFRWWRLIKYRGFLRHEYGLNTRLPYFIQNPNASSFDQEDPGGHLTGG